MRCYMKILKIGWRQKVINEGIRTDLRRGKTIFDVVQKTFGKTGWPKGGPYVVLGGGGHRPHLAHT
jgi:hypothetical protein